jgi:hypothetical protein
VKEKKNGTSEHEMMKGNIYLILNKAISSLESWLLSGWVSCSQFYNWNLRARASKHVWCIIHTSYMWFRRTKSRYNRYATQAKPSTQLLPF